jgi:hypothetical protein
MVIHQMKKPSMIRFHARIPDDGIEKEAAPITEIARHRRIQRNPCALCARNICVSERGRAAVRKCSPIDAE